MGLTSSSPHQDISTIEESLEDQNEEVNLLNDGEILNENFCLQILRRFLTFFNCDKTVRKRKRSESEDDTQANEPKICKIDASTHTDDADILNDETQTVEPDMLSDGTQTEDISSQLINNESQTDQNKNLNEQVVTKENYLDFPFLTDMQTIRDMNNSFTMIIMRGLAGSGKSTLVNKIRSVFPEAEVCSADHFFIQDDGEYIFDFSRLRDAHQYSQYRAEELCRCLTKVIIVDNTNVKRWEMGPYFKTAIKYRYSVVLVEPKTPWKFKVDELSAKNSHGVSREIIQKKVKEWQVVAPQYFGWFLNLSDTSLLLEQGHIWFERCLNSQISKFNQTFSNKEFTRNGMSGSSRDRCHCTAMFMSKEMKTAGTLPANVEDNLGQFSTLTITGFSITPRTLGARVVLTDEQLSLWNGNDHEVMVENYNSNGGASKEPVIQIDHDWEDIKESAEYSCRSSLVRVSSRYMDVERVKGRRAHITLGTVSGVKPVQTGLDQLALLREKGEVVGNLSGGKLIRCGDVGWRVELDKWIRIRGVFTGQY